MKTKVHVIFPAEEKGQPNWPYIDFDYEKRASEVMEMFKKYLPETEFTYNILYTAEEAQKVLNETKGSVDGYVLYLTTLWTGVPEVFIRSGVPVVLADDIYSGSADLLRLVPIIKKEKLPVVAVASSDFKDIINKVKLFEVISKMKHTKIITIFDDEDDWNSWHDHKYQDITKNIKDIFGSTVERVDSEVLIKYYENADIEEAVKVRDKWMKDSIRIVEPTKEELLKSAKLYIGIKNLMRDKNADAITINCLGLIYYAKTLKAYPCLAFFQLNNEGSTGVCESDLDSTITQLLLRYLTNKPGFVSDPAVDTSSNQIIYAHCVCSNKVYGPSEVECPYIIRTHAEDRKGASVQTILPLGDTITTIKVNPTLHAYTLHKGKAVCNVNDERGCRTKLGVELDAKNIIENYHFDKFNWHRVSVFGDHEEELISLAKLYNLERI